MAYFKINEPNKAVKYIKSIDRANGTLEFSESKNGCFQQDSGFFADSELAYLKFHFTEAYPELKYLTVDTSYNHDATWAIGEAPQAPVEEVEEAPQAPVEEVEEALAPVALEL
jgi:hypothetical protein